MQIEGTKLIFVMNFSVLDFFKFASRMPQIVSTFKTSGVGGGGEGYPWPPTKFPLFFSLAIPGSVCYAEFPLHCVSM